MIAAWRSCRWTPRKSRRTDGGKILDGLGGILVPGGFGERGIEGKIKAAQYARENKVPYLGLCLGMQIATIEFARNVLKLEKAHSTEFDPDTPHPVIALLDAQRKVTKKGGTMRLGAQPCQLAVGSQARETLRLVRGQRAPSPSLRVQQRLPREVREGRLCVQRHCPRTASWWKSSNCRAIRSSWPASSIRNS